MSIVVKKEDSKNLKKIAILKDIKYSDRWIELSQFLKT